MGKAKPPRVHPTKNVTQGGPQDHNHIRALGAPLQAGSLPLWADLPASAMPFGRTTVPATISASPDHTALLDWLWSKATGHRAEAPIHCSACGAVHQRDALFRLVTPTRDVIAALCDRCAELASRDLQAVEALIDAHGRAGWFCLHLIDGLDGYRFTVADADCDCGQGAVS